MPSKQDTIPWKVGSAYVGKHRESIQATVENLSEHRTLAGVDIIVGCGHETIKGSIGEIAPEQTGSVEVLIGGRTADYVEFRQRGAVGIRRTGPVS